MSAAGEKIHKALANHAASVESSRKTAIALAEEREAAIFAAVNATGGEPLTVATNLGEGKN